MMGRMKILVCLLVVAALCGLASSASGQDAPPSTDIFLVSLKSRGEKLEAGAPLNVTNREGYDNQPLFLPGNRAFLYTSQREGQTDIYRYVIKSRAHERLTATAESEYSPTPAPDGTEFSVIRVEADKTQRLWKFPLQVTGGKPGLVLERIKPVGYHAWLDRHRLVLFILGTPNTLQLIDARDEQAEVIIENIGRALHVIPGGRGKISFVHKISEGEWFVKSLDPATRKIELIVQTLPGSEDLTWLPDGSLLSAREAELYRFRPQAKDAGWQQVADFSTAGLREITRLAVNSRGDQLAFVALPIAKK